MKSYDPKPRLNHKVVTFLFVLTLMLVAPHAIAGDPKLVSHWKDRDIVVDGANLEWDGTRVYLEEINGTVAAINDQDYLYLCIVAGNRRVQRQMMMAGLTIWFDSDDGKDKEIGLRLPHRIGDREFGARNREGLRGEEVDLPPWSATGFVFVNKKGEQISSSLFANSDKVAVNVNYDSDLLTYELRIPLASATDPPSLFTQSLEDVISIGLETPKPNRDAMRDRMGGGGRGGMGGMGGNGRGGRGGGGRGGMGGGGRRPQMPKPFKLWLKLNLATESDIADSVPSQEND